MLWKVGAEALPLRGNMGRWTSTQQDDSSCPLCREHEESATHLFLACPRSIFIWRNDPWPLFTEQFWGRRNWQWMRFLLDPGKLPRGHRDEWADMMPSVALTLDVIWFARDQVVHGSDLTTPEAMIRDVHRRYQSQKSAWSSNNEVVTDQGEL